MTLFALLLIAFFIISIEAKLDAIYGDKHHTLSFIVSLFVFSGIWFLLFRDTLGISRAIAGFYAPARIWFDIIYNYFRGNKWSYLGNNSETDKFLKKYIPNQHIVLLLRMLFSYALFVFLGL